MTIRSTVLIPAFLPAFPPNTARRKNLTLTRLARSVALVMLSALLAAPTLVLAQKSPTQRIDELEKKLEQSLKQIEQLSTEVSRLRGAQPAAAAPSATAPAVAQSAPQVAQQAAKIEELERQVAQIYEANSARRGLKLGSLPLHGFADIGLGRSGEANTFRTGAKGFNVANFSLYLTPEFGDRVKGLVELLFEVDRDGSVAVDLERLQLGYTFSDAATLWGGRFHTPYGVWNTAFHHGAQIQTSLSRPRFLEFEDRGGILPAHTVGAWLTGTLPTSSMRFNYDIYVGNSPDIRTDAAAPAPSGVLNPRAGGDEHFSMTTGFRAEIAPRGALDGLKVGVHAMRSNVHDEPRTFQTRLLTYGPFVTYNSDQWEVLAELYKFRNRDVSGATGSQGSSAWYAQAGYNMGRTTPYVRAERAWLNQTDNYFAALNSGRSYDTTSLGLRFDLASNVALKFEAGRTTLRGVRVGGADDRYNEFRTQFAIRF